LKVKYKLQQRKTNGDKHVHIKQIGLQRP